jgi:WD40 repeat protein
MREVQEMLIWQAHKGKIESVAFSPDGQFLATATGSARVPYLWEPTSGKRVRKLDGGRGGVMTVSFAPQAPIFAAGTDECVRLWHTDTWDVFAELDHTSACDIAFGPGEAPMIATASTHGVRFWADASSAVAISPREPDTRYPTPRSHASMHFSPSGALLAISTVPSVTVWRTKDHSRVCTLRNAPTNCRGAVRFAPDGKRLAISYGSWVEVWSIEGEPEQLVTFQAGKGRSSLIWAVHWTADGNTLLTAGNDGNVRMWNPTNGVELKTFNWDIGKLYCAAFSPDGLTCAACGQKGQVVVWDVDV